MAADSGNSATLTTNAGNFTASIVSIAPGASTREALNVSHLSTATDHEFIPGDLWDHEEVTITFLQDVTNSEKVVPPSAVGTWTITMPLQAGNTAATYVGTGFVTSRQLAELANDTVQLGTFSFKFDGVTGPTFTAEA